MIAGLSRSRAEGTIPSSNRTSRPSRGKPRGRIYRVEREALRMKATDSPGSGPWWESPREVGAGEGACGGSELPPACAGGFPAIIPLPTGSESTGSTALIRRLASAKCLILVAAFRSRLWVVPQSGHVHSRSFNHGNSSLSAGSCFMRSYLDKLIPSSWYAVFLRLSAQLYTNRQHPRCWAIRVF